MYNLEELYYTLLSWVIPVAGFIIGLIFMKVSFFIIENVLDGMAE